MWLTMEKNKQYKKLYQFFAFIIILGTHSTGTEGSIILPKPKIA